MARFKNFLLCIDTPLVFQYLLVIGYRDDSIAGVHARCTAHAYPEASVGHFIGNARETSRC